MAYLTSSSLEVQEFLAALGINARNVTNVSIHIQPAEVVTVRVEFLLIGTSMEKLKSMVMNYELKLKDPDE